MKARLDPSLTPTVLQAVAKAACDQVEQEYGLYQASLDGHAPPTLEQPAHVASRLRGMERCLQLSLSRCEVDAFFGYGAAVTNSTVGKDVKLDPLSQRYVTREAMAGFAAGLAKSAHRADLLSAHLSPHPLTITESEIELPAGVLDALQKDPAADKDLLHQVHAAAIKAESAGKTGNVDSSCGQQGAPVGPGQNNEALWRSSFKLSELWTAFTAFKAKKKEWGRSEVTDALQSARLFILVSGDKPLRDYTSRDAQEFSDIFLALPAKYAQANPWRKMFRDGNIRAIANAAQDVPKNERVSDKTWDKHYSRLHGLFAYAASNPGAALAIGSTNPFDGFFIELDHDEDDSGKKQRVRFPVDAMFAIFTSPLYLGCQSPSRYATAGDNVFRNERYWMPILCFLNAFRLSEVAYLKVKHVKYSDGGIPFFDLSSPDLQRLLKAPESRRKLPVHPTVLALGFLEERYEGRDPEEYLFPELPLIAIELIPGSGTKVMVPDANPVSKWFGRFLDALGLEDPGLDLHATRGLISTMLEERSVGDGLIDSITGHASSQRNVRKENYSFEKDLAFKLEAIAKIDLPIDVPLLLAAWRRSPKRYDFRLPARTWRRKKQK